MGWELVDTQPNGVQVFIDGNFRLTITCIETRNLHDWVWDTIDGNTQPALSRRWEYRLWEGALFKGVFNTRDEAGVVVSKLREAAMKKKGKK